MLSIDPNIPDQNIPSNILNAPRGSVIKDGFLRSGNFISSKAGWSIDGSGNVEFNNGTFRGTISATSGQIGGWTIGATTITGGGVTLDSTGFITGGTIRTAASGTRVQLVSSNEIQFYNGSSFVGSIFASSTTGIGFFDASSVLNMAVLSTNGDVALAKSGGSFLAQSGGTFGWLTHSNQFASISAGNISLNATFQPSSDLTYDIGTSSKAWSQTFTNKILGNAGANVFDLSNSGYISTNQLFVLKVSSSDPGTAVQGGIYYNSTSNKLKFYDGGTWRTVTST